MNEHSTATSQPSLGSAVYDPSHRKAGGYWQWASVPTDSSWERVAEMVHGAWPKKLEGFKDQSATLYGVFDEGVGSHWMYRVYAGGSDSFGRPGRYFFVLFRLLSPEQIIQPQVTKILRYFETERSLPLKTEPLNNDLSVGEPNDLLRKLLNHWRQGEHGLHWGMDGTSTFVEFPAPRQIPPQFRKSVATAILRNVNRKRNQRRHRRLCVYCGSWP